MRMMPLIAQGADWETVKILVGGGVGIYAIWQLAKIVRWMLDLVMTRDKNQMERDDKRDVLLEKMQVAIGAADGTFKKQVERFEALDEMISRSIDADRKRWEDWDRDRQERLKKGGD